MTTTPQLSDEAQQDAHVQDALSFCCGVGRIEYHLALDAKARRSRELQPSVERAQAALLALSGYTAPVIKASVVGGGRSLSGQVHWLLENEGERTSNGLGERLGVDAQKLSRCCHDLFKAGRILRTKTGGVCVYSTHHKEAQEAQRA